MSTTGRGNYLGADDALDEENAMSTETTQEAPAGVPAVGTAIREARVKAGMTQDDLAEALGVTQTCVSYWENARRDLGVTDLLRVAAAINVPVVSLLGAQYFKAPESGSEPPGRYGRVEIPGYRENEGWISEETRFGLQVAVVRDRAGIETAAVGIGPLCRVVWLPVPGLRPEPLAITSGGDDEDLDDRSWGEGPF